MALSFFRKPSPDDGRMATQVSDDYSEKDVEKILPSRASQIFDGVQVRDAFSESIQNAEFSEKLMERPLFRVPRNFFEKAKYYSPERPEATVSAFRSWVYSLYSDARSNLEAMEKGLEAEKVLHELRGAEYWRSRIPAPDNTFLEQMNSSWELIHNGLHVKPQCDAIRYFTIPDLSVDGESLRGSPDLVYKNQASGEIRVVEIKFSRRIIPSNLWPDVWAQLWCYTRIPAIARAPQVSVVAEVWGESRRSFRRGRSYTVQNYLHMRATERRDPRRIAFHRFFQQLFDIYRRQD